VSRPEVRIPNHETKLKQKKGVEQGGKKDEVLGRAVAHKREEQIETRKAENDSLRGKA